MKITLKSPDDMHLHLRDGEFLQATVNATAAQFKRAIVMPNLVPPVTNLELAKSYYGRILEALEEKDRFTPLMTLYLTDHTDQKILKEAKGSGLIHGVKLYPSGATTNSQHGLTSLEKGFAAFEAMQELSIPLLIHGEVTTSDVDIFDREKEFCDTHLRTITERFPNLKVVVEHITTKDARDFVMEASDRVAATITPHHLILNRNDILAGGIKPHHYCLPVLKRETHRVALVEAAISGNPKFFAGTDSAPHPKESKESACGCAGIYLAHCAMELYAEVFEQNHALGKLENFCSVFGAQFYGLEPNSSTITLEKTLWSVEETVRFGSQTVVPFRAGEQLSWKMTSGASD